MDARDVDTQVGDGVGHGEGISAVEFFAGGVKRDPEFRVDVLVGLYEVLVRGQKLLIETVVGVRDRCGVGLAFPDRRVCYIVCTVLFRCGVPAQLLESLCVLDRKVVDELVVRPVSGGPYGCIPCKVVGTHVEDHAVTSGGVCPWNRSSVPDSGVQVVLCVTAVNIEGVFVGCVCVWLKNLGIEFVRDGKTVTVDTRKRDLIPVDRQLDPIDRT